MPYNMAADLYDKLHAQVTGIMNKLDGSHDMTHVEVFFPFP